MSEEGFDWAGYREEHLDDSVLDSLPPMLQLPALPQAVSAFLGKVDDDGVETAELVGILEVDAGLTAELLRFVNSSAIAVRSQVNSVQQALSLLGRQRTKTFVVTTGMQAAIRSRKSRLIHQQNFWSASLQKAIFAKLIAQLLRTDEELTFAGALLQDYLLPVLTHELYDEYLAFLSNKAAAGVALSTFEQNRFGWTHAQVGAGLAHRWHFPDDLVCCILTHHQGLKPLAEPELRRSPIAAIALSALLPDALHQAPRGLETLKQLEQKWNSFDLNGLAAQVDELREQYGLGLRDEFSLVRRCENVGTPEALGPSILTPNHSM